MSKTEQLLAEHLKEHPLCTEITCPHTKNYYAKVMFQEPDNGFIATVQAFSQSGAEQVVREGVAESHPHLTIKSIEIAS